MTDETVTQTRTTERSVWFARLGNFLLGGAILALLLALVTALLTRFDVVSKLGGFGMIFNAATVAVAVAVIALVVLALAFALKKRPRRNAVLGLVLSGILIAILAAQIVPNMGAPMMHDITTDVDDPPTYSALTLPEDNLRGFDTVADWQAAHRQNYASIQPVVINAAPEQVMARARTLAEENGWEIVGGDADPLRMEAIAYASFIRFRDFVVVEATPIADGSTRVDMRSVSEVGLSDLGYNADRIRGFLDQLQRAG